MSTQDNVRNEELEQGRSDLDNELFDDVPHKAEITLCSVAANRLGEVHYVYYMSDVANLKGPIGFSVTVLPNGKLEFNKVDPEEALDLSLTNEELYRKQEGEDPPPSFYMKDEEIDRLWEEDRDRLARERLQKRLESLRAAGLSQEEAYEQLEDEENRFEIKSLRVNVKSLLERNDK